MTERGDLPDYINCNSQTITHCDFYMCRDCEGTCAYAKDIGGLGVGAGDTIRLEDKLNNQKE